VTGHLVAVKPGTEGVAFQHERNRRSTETRRPDVAMAVLTRVVTSNGCWAVLLTKADA
jgi:hypothetical protein